MDPTTARLLDDLKDLLREKVITLAEWRAETAEIHARGLAAAAAAAAPPPAPAAPPPAPADPAPGTGKNAKKNAKKRAAKKAGKAASGAAPGAPAEAAPQLSNEDIEQIFDDIGFGPGEPPAPPEPEPRHFIRMDRYKHDPRSPGRFVLAQQIRAWGELTKREAEGYRAFIGRSVQDSLPYDDDRTLRLAEACDFENFLLNLSSETGRFVILEVVEERGDHDTGAWDEEDQKLQDAAARFQPHLVHDLIEGGAPICRPQFFREGACLVNLFLETFADSINARLVRPHKDLSHERLYEIATGREAPVEGPLPVSLKEADAWARQWRIPFHAVNLQGELVHRYLPEKANTNLKKGPCVWRVIVHDEHAYTVPRDWSAEQKFDSLVAGQEPKTQEEREERRRRELEGSLGQDLPCAKLYHQPTKPETLTADSCAVVDCANDCLEILEDEERKGVKMAITGAEPDEIIMELWEGGYEPKITQMKFGVAEAFVVQMGRRTLYVRRAVDGETRGDQPCIREDCALESQSQFDEALYRLRETVMPRNALSRYSPTMATALRAYKRGAPVGLLGGKLAGEFIGVDVRRAYTADLMAIRAVPVFSVFDEPRPYKGQPIEASSYYLVRVPAVGRDGIIFADEHDGVWGETVMFAREEGLPFEIVGVCKPHRVVRLGGAVRAEVQRLYASGLSDEVCKAVPNIGYGLANKHQSSKQQGRLFLSEEEARSVSSRVMPYGRGYLAMLSGKQELEEGYLPVARLVLDSARRNLYRLRKALAPLGPVAVRTDCCYVPAERAGEIPAALAAAGLELVDKTRPLFDSIGRFRLEEPKSADLLPCKPLGPRKNADARAESFVKHAPTFDEDLEMANEWDDEEATALYGPSPVKTPRSRRLKNLIIVAQYPGAGKSSISKRHALRHGEVETTLFVCPTNDLRDRYIEEGFHAITLHMLVGRGGRDGVDGAAKPYDVQGFTRVVFEEVFLYPTTERSWLCTYVQRHPEIGFVANGDPRQNKPVGETLVYSDREAAEYAFENLATVFPRRLTLKVNKRVRDPAKRAVMERLCDELDAEEKDPVEILDCLPKCGWDDIDWADGCHIVAYKSTATRVNAAAHRALHPDQGLTEFRVGDVLRGASGGCRCRGGRINSSALYEVLTVDDTHVKVRGRDGNEKVVTVAAAAKALVRPHARTNHAAQGSSIDGRIFIHDWDTPMASHVWLRTAVSRSTTCDVVLVDAPPRQRYPAAKHIAARIASHLATDNDKGLAFEEADYVTVAWVRDQFKRQRFACAGCQEPIDGETDWSIDRTNNALPHTQENCALVCRRCQNASGHRERQQDAAQRQAEDLP